MGPQSDQEAYVTGSQLRVFERQSVVTPQQEAELSGVLLMKAAADLRD